MAMKDAKAKGTFEINGRAYPVTDHTFDVVVVVRAVRVCAPPSAAPGGPAHGLHHQGVPDPLAYGRGAGRRGRSTRQYGAG